MTKHDIIHGAHVAGDPPDDHRPDHLAPDHLHPAPGIQVWPVCGISSVCMMT